MSQIMRIRSGTRGSYQWGGDDHGQKVSCVQSRNGNREGRSSDQVASVGTRLMPEIEKRNHICSSADHPWPNQVGQLRTCPPACCGPWCFARRARSRYRHQSRPATPRSRTAVYNQCHATNPCCWPSKHSAACRCAPPVCCLRPRHFRPRFALCGQQRKVLEGY